ncbi:MAG TPA: hypothetical protein VJY85_01975 [Candidatus Limnocylindria bacterium]|nr:hypothetical protein [Candidatus Limnocylindria bacterium]
MRRTIVAAVLVAISAALTGCALLPRPDITCQETVSAEDCDRAVEMARRLLAAYWDEASEVLVHPGVCRLDMKGCSERQATFRGYVTVELVSDQPESASVVIDGSNADWSATCLLSVPDAHGAHGERCAES